MLDTSDGGWGSRKLWLTVLIVCLIFAGAIIAAKWTGIASVYPEMTVALLGALSIFSGANIFGRWTVAKNAKGLAMAEKLLGATPADDSQAAESDSGDKDPDDEAKPAKSHPGAAGDKPAE